MKIEESSTFTNHEQESALSSCFHEESTPHGMSGIQINVEEASNDGHKNVVRHMTTREAIDLKKNATEIRSAALHRRYSEGFHFAHDPLALGVLSSRHVADSLVYLERNYLPVVEPTICHVTLPVRKVPTD
ncbi:TSC22 domain family protein 1 [Vespula maculifrons]